MNGIDQKRRGGLCGGNNNEDILGRVARLSFISVEVILNQAQNKSYRRY